MHFTCIRDMWCNVSCSDGVPLATLAKSTAINGRSLYNLRGLHMVRKNRTNSLFHSDHKMTNEFPKNSCID